jgi:hypothetical protein
MVSPYNREFILESSMFTLIPQYRSPPKLKLRNLGDTDWEKLKQERLKAKLEHQNKYLNKLTYDDQPKYKVNSHSRK